VVLPRIRRSFEALHPSVGFAQADPHQAGLFAGLRKSRHGVALTYGHEIPHDLQVMPRVTLGPMR